MTLIALLWMALLAPAQTGAPGTDITVKGEVVCTDPTQADARLTANDCKAGKGRYALKSTSGQLHLFLPEDPRAEIFRDPRLWNRTLRITGRVRQGNQLEIINLRAVKGGELFDVYYRCEVCNITTYSDGPCPCCQDPVEYRETPAKD